MKIFGVQLWKPWTPNKPHIKRIGGVWIASIEPQGVCTNLDGLMRAIRLCDILNKRSNNDRTN